MWRKNNETDRITARAQLKKLNVLIWKQDKLFYVCLNILLNISCVQKSRFYIPGETAENERYRAIVNSNGLYLALRALAERA